MGNIGRLDRFCAILRHVVLLNRETLGQKARALNLIPIRFCEYLVNTSEWCFRKVFTEKVFVLEAVSKKKANSSFPRTCEHAEPSLGFDKQPPENRALIGGVGYFDMPAEDPEKRKLREYRIEVIMRRQTLEHRIVRALMSPKLKKGDDNHTVLTKDIAKIFNRGLEKFLWFPTSTVGRLVAKLGFAKVHTCKGNGFWLHEEKLEALACRYGAYYLPSEKVQSIHRTRFEPQTPNNPRNEALSVHKSVQKRSQVFTEECSHVWKIFCKGRALVLVCMKCGERVEDSTQR